MNFFERQRQVRRMSARLVFLFGVAIVGIVVAVDLATLFAFGALDSQPAEMAGILLVATVATVLVILLATVFRTASLRGGGGKVARELGGVLVPQDTTEPQLRRLRNVVEEIAIASGVPVPEVYVLPNEMGINAFAAGWSTSDAAVAVTRGSLERLNRDELQGVIAHEFSHVVNGDMRLNIRLMGLLFGILFLSVIGRTLLRFGIFSGGGRRSGGDKSGPNPLPIIGIALVAAGFIGVVVGRLIKASVSRQREYLADASAVQFTRQTTGLAGALKKIGGLAEGSKIENPRGEEVGHMLFGAGAGLSSWFATHPPLVERIKVLEPEFDATKLQQLSRQWAAAPPSGLQEDLALGLTGKGEALPSRNARVPVAAEIVVSQVAAPTGVSFDRAGEIIGQIPPEFLDRARSADTVIQLVLGLLMSEQQEVRANQHRALASKHGQALADAAWQEANALAGLHPLLRLPLGELAFPALRGLPADQREAVLAEVFSLIHADGRISAFEYCLSRLMLDELTASAKPDTRWSTGNGTIASAKPQIVALLSTLALVGNGGAKAAEQSFRAGAKVVLPGESPAYAPPTEGVVGLEPVWPVLDRLAPTDKEKLVGAAIAVIGHDGVMTVTEMELLRTICGLLHCPLPL